MKILIITVQILSRIRSRVSVLSYIFDSNCLFFFLCTMSRCLSIFSVYLAYVFYHKSVWHLEIYRYFKLKRIQRCIVKLVLINEIGCFPYPDYF